MKIKCCVCHKHKKGQTTKITEKQIEYFQSQGNYVLESGIICNQCRQVFYGNGKIKEKAKNDQHKSPPSGATSTCITLPIVTVGKTTRICAVCRTTEGPFVAIPEKARMSIFIKQGLLVPVGVRCCPY